MLEMMLGRLKRILQELGHSQSGGGTGKRQKLGLFNTPKGSKPNLIMYIKFYKEERGIKKMLPQPKESREQLSRPAGPSS